MTVVLGVSVSPATAHWVLVDGHTGEGAPIDRGVVDVDRVLDDGGPLASVLSPDATGLPPLVTAVGITSTGGAQDSARAIRDELAARGLANVVTVTEIDAVDALADGIADISGYDDVAVCVVEDDVAVVAIIGSGATTVDRLDRRHGDDGADELAAGVTALVNRSGISPDAVFVLGSADLGPVVEAVEARSGVPVISASEAELALARGAALASAAAINAAGSYGEPVRSPRVSKTGALAGVLAAAVVTLVVSLSLALGLQLAPGDERTPVVSAADDAVASPPNARVPVLPPPPAAAPPPAVEAIAAAAPPVPDAVPAPAAAPAPVVVPENVPPAPAYVPPAPAYVPPAPAYVPPAPAYVPPAPAYVPPAPAYVPAPPPGYIPTPGYPAYPDYVPPGGYGAPPAVQPRLRDRILDRIPIVNRFR